MLVSLYTSRIVLKALGIDNYGVYNVVGGFISMFSIVSGPISSAISRFLTYGLGKGDLEKLKETFSTSVNVLILLSLIIVILGETVGIWFLNHKMNIPPESMRAANWVLQCSLFSMVLGLLNIPYNASIIAHEKMGVFAYMSIFEVLLKLGVAFSVLLIDTDKLILYSLEILGSYILIRIIYWIYCVRHFEECRYKLILHKNTFKEMTGFAWWTFFGNTAYMFNTQGVDVLMNIFFGVVMNTAKGIAMQVQGAVITFVNSFTTAFSPQITKSYAEGNKKYMFSIMSRGSRFSVFLFLYFLIPLEFEASTVLRLWLGEEPYMSATFLRLSLLCAAIMMIGSPFLQGINATGKIRSYQIAVTVVGCLVFPFTWIAYKLKSPPEIFYWIFLVIYTILIWIRAWYVKELLGYGISTFFKDVFGPILVCGSLAAIPGYVISMVLPDNISRLFILTGSCIITTSLIILAFGMSKNERSFIFAKIRVKFAKG